MLKIQSLKLSEKYPNGDINFEYDEIRFQNINLIIGPNASGKTKFFELLKFLRAIHSKQLNPPSIDKIFMAKILFENEEKEIITYDLKLDPKLGVSETITSQSKQYLEKDKNNGMLLLDEKTGQKKSLLTNKRSSITKQIEDYKEFFPTIYEIGSFFEYMLFLSTDKFNPLATGLNNFPDSMVLNENMANLSSVLQNWKKNHPEIYKNLLLEYKKFFPIVETFSFEKMLMSNSTSVDMLMMKEKNIKRKIPAINLSAGMLRILCLLILPMTRKIFSNPHIQFKFSLIVIDEIDNGLDYSSIENIIDYLESESSFAQIIFSSHSPLICNFVDPEKWYVFNRRISKIKITRPVDIPETKKLIQKSKDSNWELYKDHISKSHLYSIK